MYSYNTTEELYEIQARIISDYDSEIEYYKRVHLKSVYDEIEMELESRGEDLSTPPLNF